jgi:hypothetical protein
VKQKIAGGAAELSRRPRNHGQRCFLEQSRSHEIATLVEER